MSADDADDPSADVAREGQQRGDVAALLAAHGPRDPGIRGLIACLCGFGPCGVDDYWSHVAEALAAAGLLADPAAAVQAAQDRAAIERVRALADRWRARADADPEFQSGWYPRAKAIRAALDGAQAETP